jgi:hypothetical protein
MEAPIPEWDNTFSSYLELSMAEAEAEAEADLLHLCSKWRLPFLGAQHFLELFGAQYA